MIHPIDQKHFEGPELKVILKVSDEGGLVAVKGGEGEKVH